MKKIIIVLITTISLFSPLIAQAYNFSAISESATEQEITFEITALLKKGKKDYVLLTKVETQSRTSYIINKKASNKAAYKNLKKLNGKYVTAEIRILKSSNPFSHTVAVLKVKE